MGERWGHPNSTELANVRLVVMQHLYIDHKDLILRHGHGYWKHGHAHAAQHVGHCVRVTRFYLYQGCITAEAMHGHAHEYGQLRGLL